MKLSSAGLVYKYHCKELFKKYNFDTNNPLYEEIRLEIYNTFFLYVDAMDNGVSIFNEITPRTIGSLVQQFNIYNCKNEADLEKMQNEAFFKALEVVTLDFKNYLNFIFNEFVPSYQSVYDEMLNLSGDIYITDLKIATSLIYTVDVQLKKNLKYVIFKNKNDFRVLALPVKKGSFETRAPLHKDWRGLHNEALSKVSGIEGCTFVHMTGFTGGNKTLEGAIKMCEASLESFKKNKVE